MKVSLNIVKQYIDFDLPPVDELVARINAQLGGVEEVIDLAARYNDARIVKVVECDKHVNADRLNVCKIDTGSGDLVQVVCGAPNVSAGMWAVWLPPESIVPSTYGTDDEFKLGARELRGVMSNGMLASARELGIGDDHDGIVAITENDLPPGKELVVGASFAEVFGLDNYVIDIENKMFTHRPDLFGQLGVAREIAGILSHKFTSPKWYLDAPEFETNDGLALEIFNNASEKVPRFMAVAMKGVEVRSSPLWLQCALVAMGGKPINNIVDVTNYIMLLTAQPTHAYDYDKLHGHKLGVRMAKKGETVKLLNGKTYELTEDDIVIADGEGPVGLGGIMGGGESEVSADTTNIVLEVANFDMYTVRKSSMRHGVFTDALARFNKGQSPLQNNHIINLLMMRIKDILPAEQASEVFDLGEFENRVLPDGIHVSGSLGLTEKFINERLGLELSSAEQAKLLENVEIKVEHEAGGLKTIIPFWRTDIEFPEDIVEEVGRLYGYDKLPRQLPTRSTKPAPKNNSRELAKTIRETLARAGANEVLTYSFVHKNILERAGQDPENAYRLSNALSPDLQYYRLSLTPSLLDKVHMNIKAGYDEFALFEIGKGHAKGMLDEENLPKEQWRVALTLASKKQHAGSPYYRAKALLDYLAKSLGVAIEYREKADDKLFDAIKPFEPKRSAQVVAKYTGEVLGMVGEYTSATKRKFKLPEYSAGFEIAPNALMRGLEGASRGYKPLSRYPSTSRDLSFKVASDVSYGQIAMLAEGGLADSDIEFEVVLRDVYQADGEETKTITISVTLTSHDKTLSSQEANEITEKLTQTVVNGTGAEVI